MRSGPLMPMRMLHAGCVPSGAPKARSKIGKCVETGELGAAAGVGVFAGVAGGFFGCDCGAGFVCASMRPAPLKAADAANARMRIASRFEKSDTVRKTFLRGRDALLTMSSMQLSHVPTRAREILDAGTAHQ